MPHTPECDRELRKKFEQDCSEIGLDRVTLSMVGFINNSLGVIFGVFTSVIYQLVSSDVPQNKIRQVTILIISLTMILFTFLKSFVFSKLCFATYKHSRDWCKILLRNARSLKMFAMFLVTSFITTAFLKEWLSSHFSAIETLSAVWIIFLVINFIQVVASKQTAK
jgi:hypothetical protein